MIKKCPGGDLFGHSKKSPPGHFFASAYFTARFWNTTSSGLARKIEE